MYCFIQREDISRTPLARVKARLVQLSRHKTEIGSSEDSDSSVDE